MILDEVALTFVPGLGTRGIAHLTDIYSDATAIYGASEHHLATIAELRKDIVTSLVQRVGYSEAERELCYCDKHDIAATSYHDELYPTLLRDAADRPHVVYSLGDIGALQSQHILSVVGTRRISSYGQTACIRLIEELAEMFPDLVVVSGLAFGADATAHNAALAAGVKTVAIVPSKLPEIAPAQHQRLAQEIVERGGAIISELNSQTKQNGSFYIPRNRIIAAVAEGTLVVESPANGGSLSTAKAADSYSRAVLAVPGRITDSRSEGTNHLIKTNVAQLVTSAADIASALGWERVDAMPEKVRFAPHTFSPTEQKVYDSLVDNSDGLTIDIIVERTSLSISEVNAILLNMELSGLARQLPGRKYVIC